MIMGKKIERKDRNFKFETELKAVLREEVERKFREILNSKDIL